LLLDNPELMAELEEKIKGASGLLPTEPTVGLED
jgi:recombination protein RecA